MSEYRILYFFRKTETLPEDFLMSKYSADEIKAACSRGWIEKCVSAGSDLVKYSITAAGKTVIETKNIPWDSMTELKTSQSPKKRNTAQASQRRSAASSGDYYALTQSEEKETQTHTKGILILLGSFVLIVIGCFAFSGGTAAAVFGMAGVFGVIAGFFMTFSTRSRDTILYQKKMALKQAELNIQMALHGMNPAEENARVARAQQEKKAAAKEIVKGAVIGGIVAGEAGAVVGAMVAQNKQNKKDTNGH